jgi:two-component system NtrC family response regulator
MAKQKIILVGDWEEGLGTMSGLLAGSPVFEAEAVGIPDLRPATRKKATEAYVFCVTGPSDELIRRIEDVKRHSEGVPLVVFSKTAPVDFVVDMVRRGACDFLTMPVDGGAFLKKLERETHLYNLTKKIFMSGFEPINDYRFENMIGRSKRMQDNFQMIAAVAKSNATVLITGESGVGKELVAQAIHRLSERAQNRFVDINCGAIPRELLENELFGHEKGSFTGAHKRYLGSFETAHHGTLFLDEVSEMDVHLQVKLLRVLQERNFTRVGGNDRINVDVRIVAATNRDMAGSIERGDFREDLFYRLNVINIDIPALRERRDDIPLLARHFLDYYSAKNNRIFIDIAPDAMEALINYDWPGNVRELENTVERIVVLNDVSQVKLKHLPSQIQKVDLAIGYAETTDTVAEEKGIVPLEDLEKQAIEAALLKFHGNVAVAAKKLRIGQATLYRKVKKFGIAV